MNYVKYHMHSDDSLLDSCTDFRLYVDRAVEEDDKAIAFTEHGKPLNWIAKKMYCDEKGIKYIHGVECYLTENLSPKVRDNYHTILLAKNYQGVLEINRIISKSTDKEHFYFVNRISFDEFLSLSNNVIKISACLASPLNKLPLQHPRFYELVKAYDYLEIQPHNCEDQKEYNICLGALSMQYNKPLIAGTDTHSVSKYKAECRSILLKAKRKSYGDEDSFDLTYKTYDELATAFREQDALPEEMYMSAIENTVRMADTVEGFSLDKTIKYPILYGSREKDKEKFLETIDKKFKAKLESGIIPRSQEQDFRDAMDEEVRVFDKLDMCGFMLSMSELVSWCKENGMAIGTSRGSVGGSRVAYVTDITDLNPETWHTVFSRFCNADRAEIGDIDIDCVESDRPKIFEYIVGRFGGNKTARVASYGTIVDKGTIEEVGRALRYKWNEDHGLKFDDKNTENPYCVQKIDTIKKDFSLSEEKARAKYPDLFYYYDGLINTKISQSVHPAGMVIAPITLDDNYGVFEKDGEMCLMMDMDQAHEVGVAKYDFLVLRNVQIIRDAYAMLGKPYPRTDQIDFNDQNVWKDMLKSPVGIFQFEGEYAFRLLREYKPQSIFDMSLVTACIRPSGASYRDDLIAKKPHHNPSKMIDDLLKDNNGYLVYQEDVIKFLQQICGLSGSEADNVRRAIGRKKREILEEAMPKILEGYCSKSDKLRAEAEEEAKEFLQILEDSASYMFGMNHSIGYCLLGYICAYLRYYHPCEFVTSYLNNAANDDDITTGTELAKLYGITVSAPKFGLSNDRYTLNLEEKTIAKGVSSIKYMNKAVASELYELAHRIKTYSFIDVLMAMENETSIDSRQLDLLMKIDFFSAYGNSAELAKIRDMFDFFHSSNKQLSKTVKKEKLSPELCEIVSRHAVGTTKSGGDAKSFTITDMPAILHECESYIRSMDIPDLDIKVRIQNSLDVLGYVGIQTNREEDRKLATVVDIFPMVDKKTGNPWAYRINAQSLGTGRTASLSVYEKEFKQHKLSKGDVIYIIENDRKNELPYKNEGIAWVASKNKKGYWYMSKFN